MTEQVDKATAEDRGTPVLEANDLAISYKVRGGEVAAVRGVSLRVYPGETVGVVGESGCGKSTIAFGIVGYLGPNGYIKEGEVLFEGENLVGRSQAKLNDLRGNRISMVYQDPMQAMNPALTIGRQLTEVLTYHNKGMSHDEAVDRSIAMLRRVYMPDPTNMMARYPHQLSGGQQQRTVIAMAMLNNPSLLLMDEPTTALDVTVEAAVLDLVADLKKDFNTGIIFITHNLGVVARVSDKICVMYAGEMVERGLIGEVFREPTHPYTRGLMNCVPRLGASKEASQLFPIRGRVPPPKERLTTACIFAPRCDYVEEGCRQSRPDRVEISDEHIARCFFAREILAEERQPTVEREAAPEPADRTDRAAEWLLESQGLKIYYEAASDSLVSLLGMGEKKYVKAVDDVSLRLAKGRTLGVVGESGCGKSTLVKGLIGLESLQGGEMRFLGVDINRPVQERDHEWIREMQMVFQNPDSTLNPAYPIGRQIARPIRRFKTVPTGQVKAEVIRLLKAVKLDDYYYDRLPRQLSGGEKQRVGIARALASRPDLVICDEPVSALDVSVQAAVLNLLMEVQNMLGTTMIFIAHDLSVVRYFSDDVAVMYLGQVVEIGPAENIYAPPYHPYTEALLSAAPIPDPEADQAHIRLSGKVPSALNPPSGCRFHTRCPRRGDMPDGGAKCAVEEPPWIETSDGHRIRCHLPLDYLEGMDPVIHQRLVAG